MTKDWLEIDGAIGEGGGQVLRTSLALSMVLSRPVRIYNIRVKRRNPGLRTQHIAAIQASARISSAEVSNLSEGATEVVFRPKRISHGNYRFEIRTAGSGTLLFQTILLPLVSASKPSRVTVKGGTHNPYAPPFDFLKTAYLPVLERMGFQCAMELKRMGFYPRGGGEFTAAVEPCGETRPLELEGRGELRKVKALALLSGLPRHIGERELKTAKSILGGGIEGEIREEEKPAGPGNALLLMAFCDEIVEVFSSFGRPGLRAEKVAERACREFLEWFEAGVPVGRYLADQLLLPMALGKGGSFTTLPPTLHTLTNVRVIEKFLPLKIKMKETAQGRWKVEVPGRHPA